MVNRSGARERLRHVGVGGLSNAELVALLLGTGGRHSPVSVLAAQVLHETGGLRGLAHTGHGALEALVGVGPTKASRITAAVELGRRVASRPMTCSKRISSSSDVVRAIAPRLADSAVEQFIAVALDSQRRLIAELTLARGSLAVCPVAPSDVYRALLREAAAAVIFVHNHPSGEASPSADDVSLTKRLCLVGDLLSLPVLDHIIVGREGHFSFLDNGLLEWADVGTLEAIATG